MENSYMCQVLKSGITLTAHFYLDWPHFKDSLATPGEWLLDWAV